MLSKDKSRNFTKTYPVLKEWLLDRTNSHRRVVFGPPTDPRKISYVAWMPLGDHCCSQYAPQSVKELCNSANFLYTYIRLVALGVDDTYIMIWEDGTIRWDLKHYYDKLDEILYNFADRGDEISVSVAYKVRRP